ncbi:MAG: hypothetical protein K8R59_01785 [Thermoanaerobaculales bacterium]|nr:hypothetical protein [Thermoanaerobaculales bacterium]
MLGKRGRRRGFAVLFLLVGIGCAGLQGPDRRWQAQFLRGETVFDRRVHSIDDLLPVPAVFRDVPNHFFRALEKFISGLEPKTAG